MSLPDLLRKARSQLLEDSGNKMLGDLEPNMEDRNRVKHSDNTFLPESQNFGSRTPRLEDESRLDRITNLSSEINTTARGFTDLFAELTTTHEDEIQIIGSRLRDAFRSGKADVESILPYCFKGVDEYGCNLLQIAVDSAQSTTVNFLLDNDIDMEAEDGLGQTALHHAISRADTDIIQSLLERGANMEATSNDGSRPLWMAAKLGIESCARYMIEFDANIESLNFCTGTTALFEAVTLGAIPIVQMLIDNGADVDARVAPASPILSHLPTILVNQRRQRADSNVFDQNAFGTKPRRKTPAGATMAWMTHGLGSKPADLGNHRSERTTQWIRDNCTEVSTDESHANMFASIDDTTASQTHPLQPKGSTLPPTIIKKHASSTEKYEKKPQIGRSFTKKTDSSQETLPTVKGQDHNEDTVTHTLGGPSQTAKRPEILPSNDECVDFQTSDLQSNDKDPLSVEQGFFWKRKMAQRPPVRPQEDASHMTQPLTLRFTDCVGRDFTLRFESVKAWTVSSALFHIAYIEPWLIWLVAHEGYAEIHTKGFCKVRIRVASDAHNESILRPYGTEK